MNYAILFFLVVLLIVVNLIVWTMMDNSGKGNAHPHLMLSWVVVIIILSAATGWLFTLSNLVG